MFFAQPDIFTRCVSTRTDIKNITNSKQTVKVPRVMYFMYFKVFIPVEVFWCPTYRFDMSAVILLSYREWSGIGWSPCWYFMLHNNIPVVNWGSMCRIYLRCYVILCSWCVVWPSCFPFCQEYGVSPKCIGLTMNWYCICLVRKLYIL
jgi:hypothetical protein